VRLLSFSAKYVSNLPRSVARSGVVPRAWELMSTSKKSFHSSTCHGPCEYIAIPIPRERGRVNVRQTERVKGREKEIDREGEGEGERESVCVCVCVCVCVRV